MLMPITTTDLLSVARLQLPPTPNPAARNPICRASGWATASARSAFNLHVMGYETEGLPLLPAGISCSPFHPEQVVCSFPACQRRRSADYHRKKLAEDAEYRAQCEHSQKMWKENNPDYLRRYRAATKKGRRARNPPQRPLTTFSASCGARKTPL